ncbi:MAG: agmatine deiminase family protein [Flavobacteriales bacterium]|nr:agmatine deiminase family protein [Flavobacteriales bacterium]
MMRTATFLLLLFLVASSTASAQFLPQGLTDEERNMLPLARPEVEERGFTAPPSGPVRTAAEWEEIDGLCIRWTSSFQVLLRDIVRYAKEQTTVYIVTTSQSTVTSYLSQGGVNTQNIVFVNASSNSIWFRDYGQWNIYADEVGELMFVDWIYNRPRPLDDVLPSVLSNLLSIPLYETTASPTDLVNTGGNFMVDGFGTAFASELILEENEAGNPYGVSTKTETQIDGIMSDFMGIDRYIKMTTLPYDGIHHIDMHMKLLDEETLLVGQYPAGVADGPQIEANLQYVLNNFMSVYGTPYKVIRIPMPPEGGQYPSNGGDYRTYTNSVFVNRTILVPTYEQQYDTTALRIYREAMPGYNVIGINCNAIIPSSGAIHCITKAVASDDPLLISHQPLDDTPYVTQDYTVNALIRHASGIQSAQVYWSIDTAAGYQSVAMTLTDPANATWTGHIPFQAPGEDVFYYIHAEANNGKQQVRPITAPDGWWKFKVLDAITSVSDAQMADLRVYPNPTNGVFDVIAADRLEATVSITDMTGRLLLSEQTTDGRLRMDISAFPTGVYLVRYDSRAGSVVRRVNLIR